MCEFDELAPHISLDWLQADGEEQILQVLELLGEEQTGLKGAEQYRERARLVHSRLTARLAQYVMKVAFSDEATGQVWYAVSIASPLIVRGRGSLSKEEVRVVLEEAASKASDAGPLKLLVRASLGSLIFSLSLLLGAIVLAVISLLLWLSFTG